MTDEPGRTLRGDPLGPVREALERIEKGQSDAFCRIEVRLSDVSGQISDHHDYSKRSTRGLEHSISELLSSANDRLGELVTAVSGRGMMPVSSFLYIMGAFIALVFLLLLGATYFSAGLELIRK